MTAGAIFRNCGESSTSTAHSSRLRREPTLHVSGVILLSNGRTLYLVRSCLLWNGSFISCFFFILFFVGCNTSPSFRLAKWNDNARRYFTSRSASAAWHYSHANGESETSVEGNSVNFSSAISSFRRGIFRSWLVAAVFYEILGNACVSFFLVSQEVERGSLIRLFRSRCNAHGFFDRTSLPFRTATPTGYRGWSGLPRRFLRRYFIIQNSGHPLHFHRNGSWRGGSHWPPRAPETSSRCLIVDRPSHSSGSIARNFIAIFLVYGEHIIIMPQRIQVSWMRQSQHSISPKKIYIHPWRKIGSSSTLASRHKWNTYQ